MHKRILIAIFFSLSLFVVIDNVLNIVMMKGINNYFGLNIHPKILLIGHSHLTLAVDKSRLEKGLDMKVSKYCREGVNVSDKKVMVEHFLNSGCGDSLKIVLYGVDLATFTGSGLSKNSYRLFYPFMDNPLVDDYVHQHSSFLDYWLHRLVKCSRFNDDTLKNSAERGWTNNWDNRKENVIDIESYKRQLVNGDERRIQMNEKLMAQFKETIRFLTARGIKVYLVNTPTLSLLNDYEPDKYAVIMSWFRNFSESEDLVEFIDFNPKYASNFSIFSDRLHLNKKGQQIITTELIDLLSCSQE